MGPTMQEMTRHGKNSTASAVYSYSERKKDAKQSGYGTLHERLSADSIKQFDCCSITLQPCRWVTASFSTSCAHLSPLFRILAIWHAAIDYGMAKALMWLDRAPGKGLTLSAHERTIETKESSDRVTFFTELEPQATCRLV